MSINKERVAWAFTGMLWAMLSGAPVVADDTELFVSDFSDVPQAKPNILFIIDTSGSMDTEVITQATYDPSETYSGSCASDRVYWRTGTGDPPNCRNTDRWFYKTALMCDAALQAFKTAGRYTDLMAQYDPGRRQERWEAIDDGQKSRLVECEDDAGVHGDGSDPDRVYAYNGDSNQLWTSDPSREIRWGQSPANNTYTLFDGNYINWFNGPTSTSTRIQVVKDVATALLDTINGVNVGLMRFNDNEGGPVIHAMEDIATARDGMKAQIAGLPASGWTPLSETLYEAALYYMGFPVDYGDVGPVMSVAAARNPTDSKLYQSPIQFECQKNFIVLLTDGEPTFDTGATTKVPQLPNFGQHVGASCNGSGDGRCLDDLAEYLYKADLDPNRDGRQNVTTYTIGFAIDLPILASTAARGGGAYFTADDTASLSSALTNIVTAILDTQTTFTAPSVSVNSFNRTQHLNDLFITVFRASGNAHWPGNLKKYRLRAADAEILDADGKPAVDPETGFFADSARSYWSTTMDGPDVTSGGAANMLPAPDNRKLYTYLGNALLTDGSNHIAKTNTAITDALLNIGAPGDPTRDDLIDFIRGWDKTDVDQDNNKNEPRNQMGDPLHAQPASIIYGGSPENPDAVVYFATNDGILHAIDPDTGIEKWAFVPPEFLGNQVLLYKNESSPDKHYGIDGSLRIQMVADNDGIVEPASEKVYLFFGMRRGGSFYYALDVTNPDAPRYMWKLDENDLPGLGQTWSNPVPARINIAGATQNADKLVVVLGGGYDTTQDNYNASTDTVGNAIYIVDSESGNLLWHGGKTGATKNFARMDYSIPGDIKVADLNGDRYADRLYAADMGGQVWRFDILNGQPAASLVNGGVIAQLGAAPNATPPVSSTRRFYYAPDIALVSDDNQSFLHIGIGSGHRAHPNSVFNQDRFYALRDYNPFTTLTQAQYDAITPIVDADLVNVTDDVDAVVPYGSPGWRFELRDGGTWRGEKVLAEARTFNNQVFFTTFIPGGGASANGCEPALGTNRLYMISLFNGAPVNNLDGSADEEELTASDRYLEFQGSIASEVVFMFPSPDEENCVGAACTPPPVYCVGTNCGLTGFPNNPVRTFWSQDNVD